MNPKSNLSAGDFWDTLMEEQGVFFRAAGPVPEYVSPYAGEDVLVGEIVEGEQPCITA